MQVNGSIWAAQTTRVYGGLAVRWYAIDAATDILLQSGEVTDPTFDRYFPSIAVNQFDQVVIGMSGSSETDFVGTYAAVGETLGGATSFGESLLLQADRADYEFIETLFEGGWNRWGDYSATVVDPSDPRRFWTFQEYVEAEDTYGVRITKLILVPEPGTGLLVMSGLLGLSARRRWCALFVDPDAVYEWVRTGELPAMNVGRGVRPRWRIAPEALEKFMAKRAASARRGTR